MVSLQTDQIPQGSFYILSLVWILHVQSRCSSAIREPRAWNYYLSSLMNHLCAVGFFITLWLQKGNWNCVKQWIYEFFAVFQIKVNSPLCIVRMYVWGIWHISMAASAQASLYLQRYLSKEEHVDAIFTLMWTGTCAGIFTQAET